MTYLGAPLQIALPMPEDSPFSVLLGIGLRDDILEAESRKRAPPSCLTPHNTHGAQHGAVHQGAVHRTDQPGSCRSAV
eukprot:scaffold223994_cov31-Tisochrysis_lutea.AAC.2